MNVDKIRDLRLMIGEQVSENFSPTLRAKLLEVYENPNECLMEVAYNHYEDGEGAKGNHKVGARYFAPLDRIWNAYFY
jgi:hypothetical protein